MKKNRIHMFVSGSRVQGVFFRANITKQARILDLNGWVKNILDGRVEAVFEGQQDKIKKIIDWAKTGPNLARVNKVDIQKERYQGKFKNFEIRY